MTRTVLTALLLSASLAVSAGTPYVVDEAMSTLNFTATQTGAAVEGQFKKFTATIVFADANLAQSKFDVTIDVKSIDTGEDDRDDTLRGSDLFAANKFPTAKFVTTSFTKKSNGQYEALGKLTIRDVTKDVRLPFTFTKGAAESLLKGGLTLNRLDYGVGQGEWKDTAYVANEVKVSFSLKLIEKK